MTLPAKLRLSGPVQRKPFLGFCIQKPLYSKVLTPAWESKYGPSRLEAACGMALQVPSVSYRLVHNILENNRDKASAAAEYHAPMLPFHDNIRGKEVYN